MQATFSPVSFNGRIGDALEAKKEVLQLKKDHLQGLKDAGDTFESENRVQYGEVSKLFEAADKAKAKGNDEYDDLMSKAKGARSNAKSAANKAAIDGSVAAVKTLIETRQKTAELVKSIREVADHNKQLAEEAKQNLKDVGKEAKPLRGAVKQMAKANLEEAGEVADSVKNARGAVSEANDALQAALAKIEGIEKKEADAQAEYSKIAKDKRSEASKTGSKQNKEARAELLGRLVELKNERAKALDDAGEAYRTAVNAAEKVLNEYEDQAGADKAKAKKLRGQINSMNRQVKVIQLQARFTRATNLPQLAAATVALGKIGEGATKAVSNGIINTLLKSDFWAGVKGKIAAITAANVFLDQGSTAQKTVVSTGLEMNAAKIVDKTENLDVLEGLEALDKKVDELA